jgi:hypothetical protein
MALESWHAVMATGSVLGLGVLLTRQVLLGWSLRQLTRFADEREALDRWWRAIAGLPAELQTPSLRVAIGRILYQRLKRARRLQPEHPSLRDQPLRIARFIGRAPRDDGRRLTGAARAEAMATLAELKRLLTDSARDRLASPEEIERCERTVAASLSALEFQHYRQAALQAEYLQRIPQAIECLRHALSCTAHLSPGAPERRDAQARLALLETRLNECATGQAKPLTPSIGQQRRPHPVSGKMLGGSPTAHAPGERPAQGGSAKLVRPIRRQTVSGAEAPDPVLDDVQIGILFERIER